MPYSVSYAHLDRIDVEVGERVSSGQVIGLAGNSGCSISRLPQIHFDVNPGGPSIAARSPEASHTRRTQGQQPTPTATVCWRQHLPINPVVTGARYWCGRGDLNPHWIAPTSS